MSRSLPALCATLAALAACASSDGKVSLEPGSAGAASGAASTAKAPSLGDKDPLGEDENAARAQLPQHAAASALPLPQTRTYFGVRNFLQEYEDTYRAYGSPMAAYRMQFTFFAGIDDPDERDLEQPRAQVAASYGRSHWAFVFGVRELLDMLVNRSKDALAIDKERAFVVRMRFLTFLATELDALEGGKRHTDYARALYVDVAERHFGRKLRGKGTGGPAPGAKMKAKEGERFVPQGGDGTASDDL